MTPFLLAVAAVVAAALVVSGRRLSAAFRRMVAEDPYGVPLEVPPLSEVQLMELRHRYGLDGEGGRG